MTLRGFDARLSVSSRQVHLDRLAVNVRQDLPAPAHHSDDPRRVALQLPDDDAAPARAVGRPWTEPRHVLVHYPARPYWQIAQEVLFCFRLPDPLPHHHCLVLVHLHQSPAVEA